ncbi:MAG: hypothetical protein WBP45_10010 [Daejeonella sp.]
MGVDIYCWAEVKKTKWELAEPLILNKEYTFNKKIVSELYIKQNKLEQYKKLSSGDLNAIQKEEYENLLSENTKSDFEEEIAYYKLIPKFIPAYITDIRNYEWFAVLGYPGLKNIRSIDDYVPIRPIRGLPSDLSMQSYRYFNTLKEIYTTDKYSFEDRAKHSWLTLQEIMEFDWDKEIERFCFIKNSCSFSQSELTDPASLMQIRKEDKVIFAQDVKL